MPLILAADLLNLLLASSQDLIFTKNAATGQKVQAAQAVQNIHPEPIRLIVCIFMTAAEDLDPAAGSKKLADPEESSGALRHFRLGRLRESER